MKDTEIIERYWQRDEAAIARTSEKYGSYCYSVANNILHNREDSLECLNDTWLRAWNSIPPHKPKNLKIFLAKIVRNLAFNKFEERNAKKRGGGEIVFVLDELEECIPNPHDVESEISIKELEKSIDSFVRGLSRRDANLFIRRYFFTEPIKAVAERYGLSENNVTVLLSRIRRKLRKYLEQEDLV